jgi:virulence-associated protein VagC
MGVSIKAFKSGNSVAVRLPKELGITEGTELEIEEIGRGWLLERKAKKTGRELVEALARLPKPKTRMKRVRIEFPERRWGSAEAR